MRHSQSEGNPLLTKSLPTFSEPGICLPVSGSPLSFHPWFNESSWLGMKRPSSAQSAMVHV